jgi:hypothetical protein
MIIPMQILLTTTLSVPHGVGFVWATMIWDMYWAFIGESTVMTQISIMELEVTIAN